MDSILQPLLTFVLVYKYLAIFLVTFAGAVALPIIPSGSVLIASSFFATQGYLSFPLVVLTGFFGNVAGDVVAFWLAKKYGVKVLSRIGLGRFINSVKFKSLEAKITEYPKSTIFTTRFITALTPVVNIMAGLSGMSFKIFLLGDLPGELGDTAIVCFLGYIFGDNWPYIQNLLGNFALIVGLVSALILFFIWNRLSHRAERRALAKKERMLS